MSRASTSRLHARSCRPLLVVAVLRRARAPLPVRKRRGSSGNNLQRTQPTNSFLAPVATCALLRRPPSTTVSAAAEVVKKRRADARRAGSTHRRRQPGAERRAVKGATERWQAPGGTTSANCQRLGARRANEDGSCRVTITQSRHTEGAFAHVVSLTHGLRPPWASSRGWRRTVERILCPTRRRLVQRRRHRRARAVERRAVGARYLWAASSVVSPVAPIPRLRPNVRLRPSERVAAGSWVQRTFRQARAALALQLDHRLLESTHVALPLLVLFMGPRRTARLGRSEPHEPRWHPLSALTPRATTSARLWGGFSTDNNQHSQQR